MRDYIFEDDSGKKIPIAEMTQQDIEQCLQSPRLTIVPPVTETEAHFRDRLRLEVFIRSLGLRDE